MSPITVEPVVTTYPHTPDERYFLVRGRLWRLSNPQLDAQTRAMWVKALMKARNEVRLAGTDRERLNRARHEVHQAKIALGERGPVWWDDDAPDYNRCMAINTPYAAWFRELQD